MFFGVFFFGGGGLFGLFGVFGVWVFHFVSSFVMFWSFLGGLDSGCGSKAKYSSDSLSRSLLLGFQGPGIL